MKKILIISIFFGFPLLLNAALTGSGTYADPWSGTLDGNATWSGTKYINGDIIVDNEKLTISAGATIIFLAEGADLIITGTGQLEAEGTSGSMIRFTADDDDDGNYGETGERWGHISFQSMGSAGASSITFCIIEYGKKDGIIGTLESVGGGLQVDFNNITISDNYFENNYAFFGGAVFINTNRNPSIIRCIFTDNSVREAGGAVYLYNSSSTVISNCIFDGNYSKGQSASYYSGGAVQFGSTVTAAKIINSTFVNNTSDRTGDSFYTLSGGLLINSIFWGSSDQFGFHSSGGTVSYSAIQGYTAGSHFSNCFNLNSSNSASDGPNFEATDGSDWSVKFISPCRDSGTTPSPTLPNDYDGNPRIGIYDLGAYEVQYSRWLTSPADNTSWTNTGNWEQGYYPGYSGTTGDVVIPPLTGSSVAPNISGTTTISSGKYLVLKPGGKATFATLSNSGTLRLESDADSIASLIVSTYTDSGNEEIELYLTGGYIGPPENYEGRWHYISTPVSSLAVSTFAPGTTQDLAQFVESYPQYTLLEGWVAYDGYVYSTGLSNGPTFSTLSPGKGYNYWDDNDNTFTFAGTLNTSDVPMSLGYSGTPSLHGFNLLGNPFSSGLDWDDITNSVYYTYPSNTSKGLYFTRNNSQCTYINGVGTPSDVTGIIPPMQGFFTKTYSTSNTITLPAAARTHDAVHQRYKGKALIPLVRLSVTEDTISNDETVVRFDELAKSYLDNDFDAIKMFLSSTKTTIHTSLDGTDYAINGLPFPETVVEIPLVVNVISECNHKISAMQLQGLEDYNVTLKDNSTGYIADLKSNPDLIFYSAEGLLSDRFVLKVSNIATTIETPLTTEEEFNLFYGFDLINIQTFSSDWEGKIGSVRVLDMAGKTITNVAGIEFNRSSVTQVRAPVANGLYLIEIRSGVMRYVGKVVVK